MEVPELKITTVRFEVTKKWNGKPAPVGWKWYHNIFPFLYKPWSYSCTIDEVTWHGN